MIIESPQARLPAAAFVLFTSVGAITTAYTFVDLLFLSTYPPDYLPFLFLGKTVLLLAFTFLVGRLLARGSRWINAGILMVAAASILVARVLIEFPITGFPFALALWLDMVGVLAGVVAFNAVNDVFDIREMKRLGVWVHVSSGCGGLVFGLSVPFLLDSIGSNNLLLLIGIAFFSASIVVSMLQPITDSHKESHHQPLKYPLFVRTALAFIFMIVLDTFADYILKREVGLTYDREQIGSFMGPFYGITNAVTVIMQMTAVGWMLKLTGIRGLLTAMPVFGLLAFALLYTQPGLWAAAAFRMGETVLRRGFDDFGRALVANPLPAQVRRMARLLWNGVSAPIGTGLAALLLFVLDSSGVAWAVLVVSLSWLVLNVYVMRAYQQTLREAVAVRRFDANDESLNNNPQLTAEVVNQALASRDPDFVTLGLELIVLKKLQAPGNIVDHLNDQDDDLRGRVADTIAFSGSRAMAADLRRQLEQEPVADTRWHLLRALAALDPAGSERLGEVYLRSNVPEDRAGALLIRYACGDEKVKEQVCKVMRDMATSETLNIRKAATLAMGHLPAVGFDDELRLLLLDSSVSVQSAALHTVVRRGDTSLIPAMTKLLGNRDISFVASTQIALMGESALNELRKVAGRQDRRAAEAAVRTLSAIRSRATEQAFENLYERAGTLQRSIIAREALRYACRFSIGRDLARFARQCAIETVEAGRSLQTAAYEEMHPGMRAELEARMLLARERVINWYAVATSPRNIYEVMSIVMSISSNVSANDRARAMELLETYATDNALKKAISFLEAREPMVFEDTEPVEDDWLNWVREQIDRGTESELDQVQTVMLLRKAPLFSGLPGEALLAVAEMSEVREFSQGDEIFRQGDYPDGLSVVASGFVNIGHNGKMLSVARASDVIGELEVLDESPRINSAVAATDGLLLHISNHLFEDLSTDVPEVLHRLTQHVIEHLRAAAVPVYESDKTTFSTVDELLKGSAADDAKADTIQTGGNVARGAEVDVTFRTGSQVDITLGQSRFQLRSGEPPTLVDPEGQTFSIELGENLVGRDARCDIVVDASRQDVSRQHMVINLDKDDRLIVTNLSDAGLYVVRA